jgi:hypothetical protein
MSMAPIRFSARLRRLANPLSCFRSPIPAPSSTRFDDGIAPADWLADAATREGRDQLEILLARAGVRATHVLPGGAWLALNVSPDLVGAGRALRNIVDADVVPGRARSGPSPEPSPGF